MQNTARRAKVAVSDDGPGIVSHAGAVLLSETVRVTGCTSVCRTLWTGGGHRGLHDLGKIVANLAVAVSRWRRSVVGSSPIGPSAADVYEPRDATY
jgi:hypothetical protein